MIGKIFHAFSNDWKKFSVPFPSSPSVGRAVPGEPPLLRPPSSPPPVSSHPPPSSPPHPPTHPSFLTPPAEASSLKFHRPLPSLSFNTSPPQSIHFPPTNHSSNHKPPFHKPFIPHNPTPPPRTPLPSRDIKENTRNFLYFNHTMPLKKTPRKDSIRIILPKESPRRANWRGMGKDAGGREACIAHA